MMWPFVLMWTNFGLLVVAFCMAINMQVANSRASIDIHRLLSITMRRYQTGKAIIDGLDTVPYHRHFRARFLFRDPWLLYPQIVRDAVANPDIKEELPVEVSLAVGFGPPPEEGKPTIQ